MSYLSQHTNKKLFEFISFDNRGIVKIDSAGTVLCRKLDMKSFIPKNKIKGKCLLLLPYHCEQEDTHHNRIEYKKSG